MPPTRQQMRGLTGDRQHTLHLAATTTGSPRTKRPVGVRMGRAPPPLTIPVELLRRGLWFARCGMARSHVSRMPNRALPGVKTPAAPGSGCARRTRRLAAQADSSRELCLADPVHRGDWHQPCFSDQARGRPEPPSGERQPPSEWPASTRPVTALDRCGYATQGSGASMPPNSRASRTWRPAPPAPCSPDGAERWIRTGSAGGEGMTDVIAGS